MFLSELSRHLSRWLGFQSVEEFLHELSISKFQGIPVKETIFSLLNLFSE